MSKAKANTNTTQTMTQVTDAQLSEQLKKVNKKFQEEKKVKFSVPAQFKSYIGSVLLIGVNGSFIGVPVDGKDYDIPETFAKHGKQYLQNLTT